MFIVFEGGDGSGKSTQSKLLVKNLKEAYPDREIVWTREPGGTTGAEEIRGLLMSGDAKKWSAETELLLFNAARRDHVEKVIQPAIDRGAIIICDRFVGSTIAYQGVRGAELAKKARRIHDEIIGITPDVTFLLDRPAADASVEARGLDRMEMAQNAFKHKTRAQFSDLMNKDKTWVGIFMTDMEKTANVILNVVHEKIKKPEVMTQITDTRVFMDADYFASMGELVHKVKTMGEANLFKDEQRLDLLRFTSAGAENPFGASVVITSAQKESHAEIEKITPTLGGLKISFTDVTSEEVETEIFHKIEGDLPKLMAEYSGSNEELTPSSY